MSSRWTNRVPAAAQGAGGTPDPIRMARSPQYRAGAFHNDQAESEPSAGLADTIRDMLRGAGHRRPRSSVPVVAQPWRESPASGLAVTWYGHASALVEIGSRRVLTDPVWTERPSPVGAIGPRRLHPPPVSLATLPWLDAVIVSHDHYDHLDMATVRWLVRHQRVPFVVPLGVGAHLRRWGVPEHRIVELDWGEQVDLDGLAISATPARHFSGRWLARNPTLWASWVIEHSGTKAFYTGDTGYFAGFADIGAQHGPFDVTLIQIGQYMSRWPDIHMTPEHGVAAHLDVRGGLLIPVHWATFALALHPWCEPADRVWAEAKARNVDLAIPRPGQRVDASKAPAVEDWWTLIA